MSMSFYPATPKQTPFGELVEPVAGFSLDDLNLSNANARAVLAALGIDAEEGGVFDLALFAGLASAWLQKNIGHRSAAIEATESRGPTGPLVVHCGIHEGYLNERIAQLALLARRGLQAGATLMTWG